MTAVIGNRTLPVVAIAAIALALRPVGWGAIAVTTVVGAAAAVVRIDTRRVRVLGWPLVVGVGVAAFAVVRVQQHAPSIRTTAAGVGASLIAAVAEELFFRRYAYAWFERWGAFAAIGGSAVLFAIVHVPAYGVGVLPIDIAAGLVFGWQRWASGTWTAPAATHVFANLVQVIP